MCYQPTDLNKAFRYITKFKGTTPTARKAQYHTSRYATTKVNRITSKLIFKCLFQGQFEFLKKIKRRSFAFRYTKKLKRTAPTPMEAPHYTTNSITPEK
jgi:predicted nucleic acid binding AN1-type Zn finger protein